MGKKKKSAVAQLIEEEEERKFHERSESNLSEIKKAKKKLEQTASMFKKKKRTRDKTEDAILDRQKEAAIQIIKDSSKYDGNIELVRDDSYNAQLNEKISNVETKIHQLDMIFTQLVSRGRNIGREQEILQWISSILQVIVQLFHKVNLEAFRIGVLNR